MSRTQIIEQFGDAIDVSISANYQLGLPAWYEGARRLYVIRPSAGSLSVTLPIGTFVPLGGPVFVLANKGSASFAVKDIFGSTITTVAVDAVVQLFCIAGSLNGTWLVRPFTGSVLSSAILTDRETYSFTIPGGVDFKLRSYVESAFGYDGVLPAYVHMQLEATSGIALIGSSSTSHAAFRSGSWPAGSMLHLVIASNAYIAGRGGDGGRGGDVVGVLSQNGSAGGAAFEIELDTILSNYGFIQGGGGGGGGGAKQGNIGGPGGGGGAGFQPSVGGDSGSGPALGGAGGAGSLASAGFAGGSTNGAPAGLGGAGGGPGAAGGTPSISGALAGAAGAAIRRKSTATLTTLVTGTINGGTVVF